MSPKPREAMPKAQRQQYIIKNGAELANIIGLKNVTPRLVSERCAINTSVQIIRLYFRNSRNLRDRIEESRFYKKPKTVQSA